VQTKVADVHIGQSKAEQARQGPHGSDPQRLVVLSAGASPTHRSAPHQAKPYKFVRQTPGIELVMEDFEGYWRKMPHVKRLVFKSVPDATTRMAMLKKGKVDVAYLLSVPLAQEAKRDPKLKVAFSGAIGIFWLDFLDQWGPKSLGRIGRSDTEFYFPS
jgi:ABC-type transport system substrate-binding protein